MAAETVLPDATVLALELRAVVTAGPQPTRLSRLAGKLPTLFGLDCVAQVAAERGGSDYERAVAVVQAVRAAVRRLGSGPLGEATGYLLGVDAEARGLSADRRRELATTALFDSGMTMATFQRRHQDQVLREVADELREYEYEFRLRQARAGLEIGSLIPDTMAVDWLRRFEYYYGMWNALSGLRNDLQAALERRVRDGDDPATTPYALSSLWHLAQFIERLERFVQERGGLWLLSSVDAEGEVSEAVYWTRWHTPFGEVDDAWLRRHVLVAPELDVFSKSMDKDDPGQDIRGRWSRFLRSCLCDLALPSPQCEVHLVCDWSDRYMDTIDAEWAKIAPWYQGAPDSRMQGAVDINSAFSQFPYRLRRGATDDKS